MNPTKGIVAIVILAAIFKGYIWPDTTAPEVQPHVLALPLAESKPVAPVIVPLDGRNDWQAVGYDTKRIEIARILDNISSRGCKVRFSADYYVRQIDKMYLKQAANGVKVRQALGLIATGAGEVWDC